MRKQITIGASIMVGLIGFSLIGWAIQRRAWGGGRDEFEPGERGGIPRILAMLDSPRVKTYLSLTDEQTERLRQIAVDAEKSRVQTGSELAVRGIELRELLRADKPDRDAVMKKVQEISQLRGQMMRQGIDGLLAAKTVLTPEQQQKLRSFRGNRRAFGAGDRPFRGEGRRGAPPRPEGPSQDPPRPPERPSN